MPVTYVDENGTTVTKPTELEYLEYDVSQKKKDMEHARKELDKFWEKLELVYERVTTVIVDDNTQGPREDIFYATVDVFGEPYNRDVFNGDSYQAIDGHVYDWRGVEVERSWLIDRMGQCNDKNNHRMQQLERSESAYRDLERNYNKQAGKSQSDIDAIFNDRSVSTRAREIGQQRLEKLFKPVNDWKEAQKEAAAYAASELEANKYKLRRLGISQDRGLVPQEDQDKFNALQAEAKSLLKKIDAESKDFRDGSNKLKMRSRYCYDLMYLAEEYPDTTTFLQEGKDGLEDAGIDPKEFEGKDPGEVVRAIFEDLNQQIRSNSERRRELLDVAMDIQPRMSRLRLSGMYDADLNEAVPGWDDALEILSQRD